MPPTSPHARAHAYDNSESGLIARNVQSAIDELGNYKLSNLDLLKSLSIANKIALDKPYHQSITVDNDGNIYVATHTDSVPNLSMCKIDKDGNTTVVDVASSPLFTDIDEWNIGDWHYHTDGYIYAPFARSSGGTRLTKVVKIDPATLALDSVVYTTSAADENEISVITGLTYADGKWWFTYGEDVGIDKVDSFNDSWTKLQRYDIDGIDSTNFPDLGTEHVQGIAYYNGLFYMTIHPQLSGWSYRGSVFAAVLSGTTFTIVKIWHLTAVGASEAIGEGITIQNDKIYLNGIYSNAVELSFNGNAEPSINGGSIINTNLNDELVESSIRDKPHIELLNYGSHYVEVVDNAQLDAEGNFSLAVTFSPNGTQVSGAGLVEKKNTTGTKSYALIMTSTQKLQLSLNDGTDSYTIRWTKVLQSGKVYRCVVVVDKTATEPLCWLNGELLQQDLVVGTYADIGDLSNDGVFKIGLSGTAYFIGKIYDVNFARREITVLEARKLSIGNAGDVVGEYPTTEKFTSTDFSDANWTRGGSVTASGEKTFTTNAAGGCYPAANILQIRKKYRLTYVISELTAELVVRHGAAVSVALATITEAGSGSVDFIANESASPYFRLSAAGSVTFTTLTVKEIGYAISFMPSGISHVQWRASDPYNKIVATLKDGGEYLPISRNLQYGMFQYHKISATAAATLANAIPPCAIIKNIIVHNTTANAVTGGIKIGTASGGTQVVNGEAIGANAIVNCTLGTTLFSATAPQSLYVDAVTSWNSAVLNIYISYFMPLPT